VVKVEVGEMRVISVGFISFGGKLLFIPLISKLVVETIVYISIILLVPL